MKKDYIKIRINVTEHAQNAYANEYYIEAIQVLHGWIENKLQEILILVGCVDNDAIADKTWDVANQINLNMSAKALYVIGKITDDEYQKIIKFNTLRNNIIHKIYYEPYEKPYLGVPRKQYDEVFQIGISLAEELQDKTIDIVG